MLAAQSIYGTDPTALRDEGGIAFGRRLRPLLPEDRFDRAPIACADGGLLVADEVPVFWAILVSFVLSGVGSYFVLRRSREALARQVQARADRTSAAFEARRSREDAD